MRLTNNMDSDSESESKEWMISFRDLEARQKSSNERLETLQKAATEQVHPKVVPQERKLLSNEAVAELCRISKEQKEKEESLIREYEKYTEENKRLDKRIKKLKETQEELQKESAVITEKEMKKAVKPLKQAIKKYRLNLGMDIKTKNLEDPNQFVASVKFSLKKGCKAVEFIIDRKQRSVIDFNADLIMSGNEAKDLRAKATTANGLKLGVILNEIKKH